MAIVETTLRKKLEAMLGSRAELVQKTRVKGQVARQPREFLIFALLDHPDATYCYAWEVEGRIEPALGRSSAPSAGLPHLARSRLKSMSREPLRRSLDE